MDTDTNDVFGLVGSGGGIGEPDRDGGNNSNGSTDRGDGGDGGSRSSNGTGTGTGRGGKRSAGAGDGNGGTDTGTAGAAGVVRESGADQIVIEQDASDDAPGGEGGLAFADLLNVLMGGMRGGTPLPDAPLRGREKSAFKLVDRALQIADGIAVSRLGEDAAILPVERYLIANGAADYLQEGQAVKLLKYSGPAMLAAGVGLWAYRMYEASAANRARKAAVPRNAAAAVVPFPAGRRGPIRRGVPVREPELAGGGEEPGPVATAPASGNDQDFWHLTEH